MNFTLKNITSSLPKGHDIVIAYTSNSTRDKMLGANLSNTFNRLMPQKLGMNAAPAADLIHWVSKNFFSYSQGFQEELRDHSMISMILELDITDSTISENVQEQVRSLSDRWGKVWNWSEQRKTLLLKVFTSFLCSVVVVGSWKWHLV